MDWAEPHIAKLGVRVAIGYDLSIAQMRSLGHYISEPRSDSESPRPFYEPGLFAVNCEGKLQVTDCPTLKKVSLLYIVSLRGELGLRILFRFHLLILASGISLYLTQYSPLEILICTAVFISYIFLNRQMLNNINLLRFSSIGNTTWAFPHSHIARRTAFYVHLVLALVCLLTTLPILVLMSNIPFPDNGAPEAGVTFGFWFFYYLGNLGLIGIINHIQQKGELLNGY